MGLNDTPAGERVHVAFLGVRNAGKSSLMNAVAGQEASVVSDTAGTTTDPVRKAMELLPAGPVLLIDAPGVDDEGALGAERVRRARSVLDGADVAVLAVDARRGPGPFDEELLAAFRERGLPYVVAQTKADLADDAPEGPDGAAAEAVGRDEAGCRCAWVRTSAATGQGVGRLKELIAKLACAAAAPRRLVGDLLAPGDAVVLVIPLDSAAPKGRLILPQQQVIRDVLEAGAFPCCTGVEGLPALLGTLARPPRLVITDSQAFGAVARALPPETPLTSFSILMARYKGDLPAQLAAVRALEGLADGDGVLIAEGCTHHRQCEDIGTVKLPGWIRQISDAEPRFSFTSGRDFPDDLSGFSAVVHCGGCTLSPREMAVRLERAAGQGVPLTNYGMVIARAHGILARALAPLGEAGE